MTSTVLATHECPPSRDIHYSRNSSTAPLPLVPRRFSLAPSSRRVSPFVAPLTDSPPAGVIFTRASPPTTPMSSSTTSAAVHVHLPTPSDLIKSGTSSTVPPTLVTRPSPSESVTQPVLPRRHRGQRFPSIRPPEQSTPTPAQGNFSDDSPSAPRKNLSGAISRNLSESHAHSFVAAVITRSEPSPPLLRKKSGEPVKSSLKMKRTPARGSLTVITDPVGLSSSKSAPATPAHKGVRFHAQLEHVKLFLAEQKPLAVSRDGSPTDTSGTDSEFPPFIYGRDDNLSERSLVMHHVDVPTAPPLTEDTRDIAVENIDLVGTTVEGVVRVRNIAFEKWVAVRFTLDKWQTTSEVTARYKESLDNGAVDRFIFAIKLADVLSRAEEKTIFLAVRYSVAGREIWDNNNGRNYQVSVVRKKASKPEPAADIADLRRKLEQVVKLGRTSDTIGGILAQHSRRRWESPSPTPSPPPRDATPSFKSEGSLAARYDFAASLRTPWRAPAAPTTPSHARTSTYPSALPGSVPSVPWPHSTRASCGSPRDTTDGASPFPMRDSDVDRESDDAITLVPSLRRSGSGFGSRNHTRGGTLELSHAPAVKRTPPTSPFASPALPSVPLSASTSAHPQTPSFSRFNSFPPYSSPKQHLPTQGWVPGASEESTPSITSSSSSRSNSPSPSSSPAEPVVATRHGVPAADEKCDSPVHHLGNYNVLLNRTRWTVEHSNLIPRSYSASSVEEFLSAGQSPPLGGSSLKSGSPFATPRAHRRVSATASDDELQRSGSATPTGPTLRCLPLTPSTPLLF
ncbi:putative phosphatase regulatory subunit-domain-containing protein [Multifurca ochricompacta]|uniref:Phosphatase regulatory subunit-domain-containing protein n=1 Tax=Multifurca ochricompacta TaxID=376703 RepID=A0AAD4M6B0_9AGAM|nr:putative phosphatase regulatory subunit-domain-containing protein [Multifurca ochricompacta]